MFDSLFLNIVFITIGVVCGLIVVIAPAWQILEIGSDRELVVAAARHAANAEAAKINA